MKDPQWKQTSEYDLGSILDNQTWNLVDRCNKKIIGTKWDMKTKYKADVFVDK